MGARDAPAHPLVLAAAALIVVNDYVLRGWAPGWLTGKASDVAWLVLVPVLLAAVLARCNVPDRRARAGALVVTVVAYTALQLWPPLGAFFRPGHVADVEDLLALPAILGAIVAWRARTPRPRASVLALPVVCGALVADDWSVPPSATWPCGSGMRWDAADPLVLRLSGWWWAPVDTDAFQRRIRLTDAAGVEVPLVAARGDDAIHLCARDGLRGDTDYTWEIGPWEGGASNEVSYEHEALPTVTFRTTAGDGPAVTSPEACLASVAELDGVTHAACDPWAEDTGPVDTGDTAPEDTAPEDTADTGDTSGP